MLSDTFVSTLAPSPELRFMRAFMACALEVALTLLCCAFSAPAGAAAAGIDSLTSPLPAQASPVRLFAVLRHAVLTVRTVEPESGRMLSHGSGFVVDADGRAITNFHVVADHLHQPNAHRLEVIKADKSRVAARVLTFDIINDLAVLQVQGSALGRLTVPETDVPLAIGTALFSLGNPKDLGVTVMAGHFSGQHRSLGVARVHFSGSVNAGMSGGPVVDGQGRLVGVNVSRQDRAEQIAFLVPAADVRRLLRRPTAEALGATESVNLQIARQLQDWEQHLFARATSASWPMQTMGPFRVPDILADELKCWAGDNLDSQVPPPVKAWRVDCNSAYEAYLRDGARSARVSFWRAYLQSHQTSAWQFARVVDAVMSRDLTSQAGQVTSTQHCADRMIQAKGRPSVRMVWCAAAYRDLQDLYDVDVALVIHGLPTEALVVRLTLEGVRWQTGQAFATKLLEAMT